MYLQVDGWCSHARWPRTSWRFDLNPVTWSSWLWIISITLVQVISGFEMNVCACKTKTSKERLSMRQNAQQHDTGIDLLVLKMLLPLHSLHLLLSHRCSQMLLPPHCLHLLFSHWSRRCCCRHILYSGSAIGAHKCRYEYSFALAPLPLLLVQSTTQMYTIPKPLAYPCTYRVWGPGRGNGAL